jgi:hypothetical protein
MRRLLTFLIAMAPIVFGAQAHAHTLDLTFDFGPESAERMAFVMLVCETCHGASSVTIDGSVKLKRDASSEDVPDEKQVWSGQAAEIWSGPLPMGIGKHIVTINGDYPLKDAIGGMASANNPPIHPVGHLSTAQSGQKSYSVDVNAGDVVLSVSFGGGAYAANQKPMSEMQSDHISFAAWNIDRDASLAFSSPSFISATAVYR